MIELQYFFYFLKYSVDSKKFKSIGNNLFTQCKSQQLFSFIVPLSRGKKIYWLAINFTSVFMLNRNLFANILQLYYLYHFTQSYFWFQRIELKRLWILDLFCTSLLCKIHFDFFTDSMYFQRKWTLMQPIQLTFTFHDKISFVYQYRPLSQLNYFHCSLTLIWINNTSMREERSITLHVGVKLTTLWYSTS